jgi:hypothetical protein
MQVFVVQLPHLQHVLHEFREILELGPLVVRGANWHIDFNGFFDRGGSLVRAVFLKLLGQHHAADRKRGHCNYSIQHC